MKKILFVDDELHLLDGLKRSLRPHRNEWDMHFAVGAEQALSILAKAAIDVVVTDMRMPGMDGAGLLQYVHQRYPHTMRIVLSGHFSNEAGMRAVPVAHQFLMKPCDLEQLSAAIGRSSHVSQFQPDEATKRVISSVGSLPSPPLTCTRMLAAVNDEDSSVESISTIIDQDVALAAKILQLGNSPLFNLRHEVTDVKGALAVLGLDALRQLVLSAEIVKIFKPPRPIRGFSLDEFQRHSHLTAQIAARLPADPSAVNLRGMAALLHDTGKLILAAHLPRDFERACEIANVEGCAFHVAERRLFGTSHAEIGAYLLHLWGLPLAAVEAVAAHNRPVPSGSGSAGLDLIATVHIASALAHDCGGPTGGDLPLAHLDHDYIGSLGVKEQLALWRTVARQSAGVAEGGVV